MKKIILTLALMGAVAASSFGQGSVNVTYSVGGNGVRYNGELVTSAMGIRLEFLWAPLGTTDLEQFQVLGNPINAGVPTAGFFSGGTRTITGIAPGAEVAAYVRGWVFAQGATYDEAPLVAKGYTPIFTVDTADFTAVPPQTAPNLNSVFPGLNIVVPEPSSMALAGLGAASLLIFRRRK